MRSRCARCSTVFCARPRLTDGASSRDQRRARSTGPRRQTGGPDPRGARGSGPKISSPVSLAAHAPQDGRRLCQAVVEDGAGTATAAVRPPAGNLVPLVLPLGGSAEDAAFRGRTRPSFTGLGGRSLFSRRTHLPLSCRSLPTVSTGSKYCLRLWGRASASRNMRCPDPSQPAVGFEFGAASDPPHTLQLPQPPSGSRTTAPP